uniref:START domain-containing protein 10 n=1 Tax=Paramormyrops kingsleyae TaxID=1676925 RepID=A0A3B3QYM8_9TELE
MSLQSTVIPDESVFAEFRAQCLSTENWLCKYNTCDMEVWTEMAPGNGSSASKVHKIKCRRVIQDVSAATMYDVLHDSQFRVKWDPTMLESFDIGRLSANTDVGYYSWLCPKPLKNRDVVTLRSWRVKDDEYLIINYSVMHPKYPPRTDLVRAVSIITGYMLKVTGPNSCVFFYLSQGDPKGSIPKWLVNKASQVLAPKVRPALYTYFPCCTMRAVGRGGEGMFIEYFHCTQHLFCLNMGSFNDNVMSDTPSVHIYFYLTHLSKATYSTAVVFNPVPDSPPAECFHSSPHCF